MKLMFGTMGAAAERGMSNPGTLRGVRPVGPTEIDELKKFDRDQRSVSIDIAGQERRGAQAIGEAALRVVHGLATLPRRNTSELKIAVIADLALADGAAGRGSDRIKLLPEPLQLGKRMLLTKLEVGHAHAVAAVFWRRTGLRAALSA